MTDDLVKRLRAVGGLRHDGATRWYVNQDGPEAAARIEALETFVCSIAWGPPHIIEYNTYINSLVDKAQRLCPKNDKKEKPSNVVSFDRI